MKKKDTCKLLRISQPCALVSLYSSFVIVVAKNLPLMLAWISTRMSSATANSADRYGAVLDFVLHTAVRLQWQESQHYIIPFSLGLLLKMREFSKMISHIACLAPRSDKS